MIAPLANCNKHCSNTIGCTYFRHILQSFRTEAWDPLYKALVSNVIDARHASPKARQPAGFVVFGELKPGKRVVTWSVTLDKRLGTATNTRVSPVIVHNPYPHTVCLPEPVRLKGANNDFQIPTTDGRGRRPYLLTHVTQSGRQDALVPTGTRPRKPVAGPRDTSGS